MDFNFTAPCVFSSKHMVVKLWNGSSWLYQLVGEGEIQVNKSMVFFFFPRCAVSITSSLDESSYL
jgi:hypothetical protein